MSTLKRALVLALVGGTICGTAVAASAGPHFSAWNTAQKVDEIAGNHVDLNTASLDGCPVQSPDGLSLYMASNRPGSMESSPGVRSLDIWVAHRTSTDARSARPSTSGRPSTRRRTTSAQCRCGGTGSSLSAERSSPV
jgi:WD40-like Beta Propeller Repeat